MTTLNIRDLRLRSGESFEGAVEVELEPLRLGGQRYLTIPEQPTATISLTRATSGLLLELSLQTVLAGPCVRCLEDATVELRVRAREYDEAGATSEELRTPYLTDGQLDVSRWARDALVLASPEKILCQDECAGLCAGCGVNLNTGSCTCPPPAPDPRLSKLAELRDRL